MLKGNVSKRIFILFSNFYSVHKYLQLLSQEGQMFLLHSTNQSPGYLLGAVHCARDCGGQRANVEMFLVSSSLWSMYNIPTMALSWGFAICSIKTFFYRSSSGSSNCGIHLVTMVRTTRIQGNLIHLFSRIIYGESTSSHQNLFELELLLL